MSNDIIQNHCWGVSCKTVRFYMKSMTEKEPSATKVKLSFCCQKHRGIRRVACSESIWPSRFGPTFQLVGRVAARLFTGRLIREGNREVPAEW